MLAALWVIIGFVLLVVGAELLVRGSSHLATSMGISPLVVGLTVVSFGTSAPELAVSVSSVYSGRADFAMGNVVGSNIFNVLLIMGLSAMIVPLVVDQKLIRRDVPIMIAVSLLLWWCASDGLIDRLEGGIAFVGLIVYTVWCMWTGGDESEAVKQEYATEFGEAGDVQTLATGGVVRRSPFVNAVIQVSLVLAGLGLLVSGSHLLVEGAVEISRWFGVSELVIGLTVIATGTSLPELATSLVAAMRGERDIAVGNVVGSNLFNMLGVVGLSATVAPAGIAVAEQAISFDIPVMVAVAVACLPIFARGHRIDRWEGCLFFVYYILYTSALILISAGSPALPLFRSVMLWLVIPTTVVAVASHMWWSSARKSDSV